MEKRSFVFGTILLVLGMLILLANFDVRISDWILLAIGLVLFVIYFVVKKSDFLLVPAIYFGTMGIGVLLKIFLKPDFFYFEYSTVFLFAVTLASLIVYFIRKHRAFGAAGFILTAFALYNAIIDTLWRQERIATWWPLLFMLLALSFLVIFVVEHKAWRYFPLIGCVSCFAVGFLGFARARRLIGPRTLNSVYEIVLTMWPVILIVVGMVIIFNTMLRKR